MNPTRYLTLAAILACLVSRGDTDGGIGQLHKMASSAVMGKVNKFVLDKMDLNGIKDVYVPALNTLKTMDWSCVRGVFVDVGVSSETLKLTKGKLSNPKAVNMILHNMKPGDGDTVTATVSFQFPPLTLDTSFLYTGKQVFISYQREGTAKLKLGPAIVEVSVKVPNSHSKLTDDEAARSCLTVQTKVKNEYEIEDVTYPSVTGFSLSEKYIRAVLTGLKRDVLNNVRDAIQAHVQTALKTNNFLCPDQDKLKPLNPDKDCEDFRTATMYNKV